MAAKASKETKEAEVEVQETKKIVVRFVLDLQAEDSTSVDVEFVDEKQAKKAINLVMTANGALVSLTGVSEVPVLLRTSSVAAAFTIEYDEDDD